MPLTIGLVTGAVGLIGGGIDMWQGKKKEKEARKQLENLKRPMMQVPEAQNQQLALYSQMMSQDLPGMRMAQQAMDLNTAKLGANALRVGNSQDALSALTSLAEQQEVSGMQLAIQNAQYKERMAQQYAMGLGNLALTQKEMFQINQLQPYMQKYQQLSANMAAGQQQFAQGLGGIGSSFSGAAPMIGAGSGAAGWENMRAMYGTAV
jgi:hypothetical protein